MSEVQEYGEKLDKMGLAQLQEELKDAQEQQAHATGEYGYWGGVTKEEMVSKRIKKLYENQLKDVIAYMGLQRVKEYVVKQIEIKETEEKLKKLKKETS